MGVAAPDLSVAQIEEEFTEAFEYNPNPFPLHGGLPSLGRGAHRVEHRLPPYGEASPSTWRTLGCPAICNGFFRMLWSLCPLETCTSINRLRLRLLS